ncbi:MAG: desulfoferrodoxin Dfx [Lachnospiraceae bacterium]|nr:desulfoferrodoxin Dfx [Lachnospiraceae bacterium]
MRFYRIDGQIVISDKELTVGEEVAANTTDGAHEKHVPVVEVDGKTVTVKVGSVEHPSLDAHYIEWILLETAGGMQMRWLKPGMKPEAVFLVKDKPVAAYEYCNLHGLWKADINS